jgi:hypothetical protein
MTEIAVTRIINVLLQKGFVRDESHHTMLRLVVDGRKTRIHTWFSHGRRKPMIGCLAKLPENCVCRSGNSSRFSNARSAKKHTL